VFIGGVMKKSLRILTLVLALLMVVPLMISCKGSKDNSGNKDSGAVTTVPDGDVDPGAYVSKLPSYDWDGDNFTFSVEMAELIPSSQTLRSGVRIWTERLLVMPFIPETNLLRISTIL
jgi:hypothetical protein